MQHDKTSDIWDGEIYLAGERVAPGLYRQIGGSRELRLEKEDYLPGSLDGQVACYERVEHRWAQKCQSPQAQDAPQASVFPR